MTDAVHPKPGDIQPLPDGYLTFDGTVWIKHRWSVSNAEDEVAKLKTELARLQEENARLKRMLDAMSKEQK